MWLGEYILYRPKNTTISCSDIDDCASKPCVHATNCTDLQQDFSCVCESGWKGKTCNDSKIIFYQTIACILKAHPHSEWRFNLSFPWIAGGLVSYLSMWLLTLLQLFKNSIDTQGKLRLNLHSLSASELLEYRRMSVSFKMTVFSTICCSVTCFWQSQINK
jgi:hypothetical protein